MMDDKEGDWRSVLGCGGAMDCVGDDGRVCAHEFEKRKKNQKKINNVTRTSNEKLSSSLLRSFPARARLPTQHLARRVRKNRRRAPPPGSHSSSLLFTQSDTHPTCSRTQTSTRLDVSRDASSRQMSSSPLLDALVIKRKTNVGVDDVDDKREDLLPCAPPLLSMACCML